MHPPGRGSWNMAVDAALLQSVQQHPQPMAILRWYRWQHPTLSLGHFQTAQEAREWLSTRSCHLPTPEVVKRITGGGAILHHHEWTYCCVLPYLPEVLGHPYRLYNWIHEALCQAFRQSCGLDLSLRGTSHAHTQTKQPTLCFLRQDARDVCFQQHKVIGSAQRRRYPALLQHGSILLRHSAWTPEVVGLIDLAPEQAPLITQAESLVVQSLAQALGNQVVLDDLTPQELTSVHGWMEQLCLSSPSHQTIPEELSTN
ncbi:MAG: hypothetical protein KatS3mg113_0003 [Planctomycetaceae bacterium]|nr:MAG: hypothetical protein KatS3mg113_0003 [Planctomycetaceae bacterium]